MRGSAVSSRRGGAFLAAGMLVLVAAFGASWAFAPEVTTVPDGRDAADATILVGVQGPGPNGSVTALAGDGEPRWTVGDVISYQNVQRLDNGSVLATFAAGGYEECGPYDPPCKRTGVRIIEPKPHPRVVWGWSYPVRTRKDSEVHDAERLPSGDILVADMEYESVFVLDPETRERVWTWNASRYYDAPADPTRTDWLHLNDADRIGDGRYLVSIRNENQLLVVERGEGVVEVINEDGDPDVLNRQHNPHWLADGAVLVADSENHRVVELHENETTGEWTVAWSLTRAGGIPFNWPRDADRLPNGHTFITDSRNNRVVEVRENGSVVASYAVPSLPYESDYLPRGESTGGPVYSAEDRSGFDFRSRRVPVLSTVLAGVRHVVATPYWVSELHLLAVGLSVALWTRGGYLLVRGDENSDEDG